MFGKLGAPEIAIILGIILLIFGPGKLPQVAGSIGKSLRAFRKTQTGEENEEAETKAKKRVKRTVSKKSPMTPKAIPATFEIASAASESKAGEPAKTLTRV